MKWVLKLGGSLYSDARLASVVRHAAKFQPPPVIVPGGGPFADQVRRAQKRWLFGDATAHTMAVTAMRQYGLLLAELGGVPAGGECESPPCVWLPDADAAYDEADWTLTSDSIAAHFAQSIRADALVLLKPTRNKPLAEVVDDKFIGLIEGSGLRVAVADVDAWLSVREFGDLAGVLGLRVIATRRPPGDNRVK